MNKLTSIWRALLVSALLAPALFATTMTSLSSFGGIEEPVDVVHTASDGTITITEDTSFINITNVSSGTVQMLLRYTPSQWDGDRTTGNTDRGRAEVKTLGPNQKIHETYDYTTTWKTNSGFVGSGGFCHITQLKPIDGVEGSSGAPLVVTSIGSGTSSADVAYASTSFSAANVFSPRTIRNITWSPNTALALKIRIKTTADGGSDGIVQASVNGDALQGVTNVEVSRPSAQTYYPKWGLYRKQTTTSGFSANDFVQHSNVSANLITGTSFDITASAGANGSISPSGTVSVTQGANQTFSITPNSGFAVADVTVDGTSVGAVASYTFSNVQATHTINATFQALVTNFTITASAGANGSISPSGTTTVAQGGNQSFTIAPTAGFAVASVTVDGVSVGAVTSYTFSNVQANHTISATFQAITYAITASAGTGGSISPSGTVTVNQGASQSFTITPNSGFAVSSVTVDGTNVGAVSTYTFSNVQAAHTISASFQAITFAITASAGANGSISPSGTVTVNQGASQSFTITPSAGFAVASVTVDGASVGAVTTYTFSNVQAAHTISATFAASSGPISLEAEALTRTSSGATTTLQTDANTSGGQWISLDGTANGQYVEFTLPNIPAGTYSLKMAYKTNNNRGILSLSVDGTQVGSTLDQYASPSTYPSTTFGNVTFATTGNHLVRLTVVGRNASSSSSTLSADKFTLTPTTTPPPTVTMEAESLTTTTSGPTVTTGTDANASGGVITYFNATAVAQWVQYTTVSLPAGTYQIVLHYKQNTARGQHTLTVDGSQIGGTIDEYGTTSSYVQATAGNVTFASAGTHTIRLTVTGKNASSTSYVLAPDSFVFIGQ